MNRHFLKIFVLLTIISTGILSSCKDPVPPKAIVTVRNGMEDNGLEMNVPLEGAFVTVFIDPNTGKPGYTDPDEKVSKQVKQTDGSGKASFDFSLENILQVQVKYPYKNMAGEKDSLYGEGVLVLEEDKTYEETIYLRKYSSQL